MESLHAAKFDFAGLLSDEIQCSASHRRSAQSVDRSLQWLEQALAQVGLHRRSDAFSRCALHGRCVHFLV